MPHQLPLIILFQYTVKQRVKTATLFPQHLERQAALCKQRTQKVTPLRLVGVNWPFPIAFQTSRDGFSQINRRQSVAQHLPDRLPTPAVLRSIMTAVPFRAKEHQASAATGVVHCRIEAMKAGKQILQLSVFFRAAMVFVKRPLVRALESSTL